MEDISGSQHRYKTLYIIADCEPLFRQQVTLFVDLMHSYLSASLCSPLHSQHLLFFRPPVLQPKKLHLSPPSHTPAVSTP